MTGRLPWLSNSVLDDSLTSYIVSDPSRIIEYTLLFLILSSFDLQLCSLDVLRVEITGFSHLLPLFLACLRMGLRETLGLSETADHFSDLGFW